MGPVNAELAIDVPREAAFDYVADLANRPAFTDHFIGGLRLLRVESTGVGAGARFRFLAPPQAIWMDTTITELEPPHRISERGRGGRLNRIPSATEWELLGGPRAADHGPGHLLDRARAIRSTALKEVLGGASIWYGRDWATALRRLRDRLETGQARQAPAGGGRQSRSQPAPLIHQ